MTPRLTARLLAGTASVAILVAACGGGTASTAPTGAPATPTAAPVVTQAPGATVGPGATFDLASFHADTNLEDLFPDSIGGKTITPLSMSGADLMGSGNEEMTAMLAELGKAPADLSAAFGGTDSISIIAFRVKGKSGSEILTAFFNAYSATAATVGDASFGGKSVKKVVADGETSYVYAVQDAVFIVGGPSVTNDLLNEAFSKLP